MRPVKQIFRAGCNSPPAVNRPAKSGVGQTARPAKQGFLAARKARDHLPAKRRMLIWCDSRADGIVRMKETAVRQVCCYALFVCIFARQKGVFCVQALLLAGSMLQNRLSTKRAAFAQQQGGTRL